MPKIEVTELSYAGFFIRLLACFIDRLIVFFLSFAIAYIFSNVNKDAISGIFVFVQIFYFSLMESSASQATFGKMLCGLKVARPDGEKITFPRAFCRDLSKFLSEIVFFLGFIMIIFTQKKQGLHDKICDTCVLYKSEKVYLINTTSSI